MIFAISRIGLQAIYFFSLPKSLGPELSAAIFLAFSISAIVPPVASMGSQFSIIRSLSLNNPEAFSKANTIFASGFINILFIIPVVSKVYEESSMSMIGIYLIALSTYVRLYVDSYLQGIGKFNVSQKNYIFYWSSKLLIILWIYQVNVPVNFTYISIFEILLLSIWVIPMIDYFGSVRFSRIDLGDIKEGLIGTLSTFSRGFWLEADKLILPHFMSNSVYVTYSLVARVLTAGISLISAFISSITPQIISSEPETLNNLWKAGRNNLIATLIAMSIGFIGTYIIYPEVKVMLPLMVIFMASIPIFTISSILLDFVFYRISFYKRLYLNIVGCMIFIIGISLSRLIDTYMIGIALFLSFYVTYLLARRMIRTVAA